MDKFKQNPDSLTLLEKIQIQSSFRSGSRQAGANIELKEKFPLEWLKNHEKLFKDSNIEIDFNRLKSLSKESQAEEVSKLLKTWSEKTNKNKIIYQGSDNPYHTLYHEMGHLQDYAMNLEKLQKEELGRLNFFTVMKNAIKNKNGKINSIADHWGGTTYEIEQELMEKSPELFNNECKNPELKRAAMSEFNKGHSASMKKIKDILTLSKVLNKEAGWVDIPAVMRKMDEKIVDMPEVKESVLDFLIEYNVNLSKGLKNKKTFALAIDGPAGTGKLLFLKLLQMQLESLIRK